MISKNEFEQFKSDLQNLLNLHEVFCYNDCPDHIDFINEVDRFVNYWANPNWIIDGE